MKAGIKMMQNKPILFTLSKRGEETAKSLQEIWPDAELHGNSKCKNADSVFENAIEHLQYSFKNQRPIIGFCAAGILIRALSPLLQKKTAEMPVIAVSEDGKIVVPLLGGHRGANRMATEISQHFEGLAAITTSGETHFNIALDEPPAHLILQNPEDAKAFTVSLLDDEKISFSGNEEWFLNSKLPFDAEGSLKISVTCEDVCGNDKHLVYHEKTIVLGMGAERGAPIEEAIRLAETCLKNHACSSNALIAVASLNLKSDEACLQAVAEHFQIPFWTYEKAELKTVEKRLLTPSDIVEKEVGVKGVAEAAALFAAGDKSTLLGAKQKSTRITVALGKAENSHAFKKGQERGALFLVGTGPGKKEWRSFEAETLLQKADHWVGYDLYLDLIQDLKISQKEHRFPLGAEEDRVRYGLELAGKGEKVALVCSGDPGIYAMATLAYELMDTGAANGFLTDAAKRVEVFVSPGISAFQAAAARSGALIGHDFCCISLSDLLTPRNDILKRLEATSKGDFVTAFYNPRSKRRVTLLDEAFEILRQNRPPETPVILAFELGRDQERITHTTLKEVKSEDVDMLTLVMVGSSNTKSVLTGDGKKWAYTPRGYHRKNTV